MPIVNLGDISFGVLADTRPLRGSIADIQKFGQTVNTAARLGGEGARALERDLRKQEAAVLNALQSVLKYNQSVRLTGKDSADSARLVRASNKAFRELTQAMTSGRLSALDFQRVMERFNATMGTSQRAFRNYRAGLRSAITDTEAFSVTMRDLTSGAIIALGPLSGVGARIAAISSISLRSSKTVAAVVGSIAALTVGIGALSVSAVRANREMAGINARMLTVADTAIAASRQIDDLKQLADDTGTVFSDLAGSFARMQSAAAGTSLEGEGIAKVLEDITFGAANFRLPAEQVVGTLRALEQIMSKGTVQAEELRGQLGDRLTGAFNIAARAMGVTTIELNKMLKDGTVLAEDFLPKFAAEVRNAFGAEASNRIDTMEASINRLRNAMFHFAVAFDEAFRVGDLFKASVEGLTNVVDGLTSNMSTLINVAQSLTFALIGLAAPEIAKGVMALARAFLVLEGALLAVTAASVVSGLSSIAASVGVLIKTLRTLNFANLITAAGVLGGAYGKVATILFRVAGAVGTALGAYALFGGESEEIVKSQKDLIDSVDEFIKTLKSGDQVTLGKLTKELEMVQTGIEVSTARIEDLKRQIASIEVPQQFEGLENTPFEFGSQAQDEVNDLAAAMHSLRIESKKLEQQQLALKMIQDDLAQAEMERQAETVRARQAALAKINESTDRLLAEAAAMRQGEDAVIALKQQFKELDAVRDLEKDLADEGFLRGSKEAVESIDRLRTAFAEMRSSTRLVATEGLRETIDELNKLTLSTLEGAGAFDRLKRELDDQAAVEAQRSAIFKLTQSYFLAEEGARRYGEALKLLREVQDQVAASDLARQVDRLERQTEAFKKGEGAVKALNNAFADEDTIREYADQLDRLSESQRAALPTVEQFTARLKDFRAAEAISTVDELSQVIRDMNAEAANIRVTTDSFEDMKQQMEDNAFIRDWAQKLEGASIETEEAAELIRELIAAFKELRAVTAQAGADQALSNLTRKVQNLALENAALAKGSKAFDLFKDNQGITNALAEEEKLLRAQGLSAAEATFQLQGYRKELEANASLLRALQGGGGGADEDPIGALAEVEQQVQRINALIEGQKLGPAYLEMLNAQFQIEDQVNRTFESLVDQGVASQVAAEKTLMLRDALVALDEAQRQVAQNELLGDVETDFARTQAVIDAMRAGLPVLAEELEMAFEREDQIDRFRSSLEQVLTDQDLINELTDTYIDQLNRLDQLAPVWERQVEAVQALRDALKQIEDGVSQILADMITNFEFSFEGLVDLGRQVVNQLLKEFLRLTILKPLLGDIFQPQLPGQISGGSTGGGGLLSGIAKGLGSLVGGLIGGGGSLGAPVPFGSFGSFFAKGGIIDGPTALVGTNSFDIAGEAGGEGVLPLMRDSSGNLGVRAIGSGGVTNVFNIAAPVPSVFFQARSQMAAQAMRVTQAGERNL